MRVKLLGPVSATVGDVEIRLGGRKQRAVLALLALEANRAVPLHRLVHEVWRDEPPARATLSLQSYISRLRRMITEAHASTTGDPVPQILTRPPGWVLVLSRESVDVLRFADLVKEGHALLEDGQAQTAARCLREALDLWTGEPLADIEDAPFAEVEGARLQGLRLTATEALFSADLGAGRSAQVAEEARGFVEENPYRERAWCALMLALYRRGRQAEALTAAQELRVTLSEGLGLDPSPEARLLQDQILRQDPALERPSAVRVPGPPGAVSPVAAAESGAEESGAGRFVGRGPVLDVLDRAAQASAGRRGGLLIVDGPAGMGKSTVLQQLCDRVQQVDGLVVRGAGITAGSMPALWPWVTVVRQLVSAAPDLAHTAREGGSARALTLLDPSVGLGGQTPTAWAEGDPQMARTRLYRAVVDLLAEAHRTRPVTLVLDDAQWLDADTLGLLTLAADELIPQGVLFVIALRSDESPKVQAEVEAVARRHRHRSLRVSLDGLSVEDVEQIVRLAAPGQVDRRVAEAVQARTGGNPLFVNELVQLLVSERRLDPDSVYAVLPAEIRDVLRQRLDRLPDRTRMLLTVVALFNRAVDVGLLAAVTGMSVDATLDDCEAAVASSLLLDDADSGGFVLSHDLVRQTLEEAISPGRKVRMHAQIAGVLQVEARDATDLPPERVVDIARHLTLAETVVGANAAVPYLVAIADDARARSAFQLAESALRAALELSARIANPAERRRTETAIRTRLTLQSLIVANPRQILSETASSDGEPAAFSHPNADPLVWWGGQAHRMAIGQAAQALIAAEGVIAEDLTGAAEAVAHTAAGLACFVLGRLEPAEHHLAMAEELSAALPGEQPPWILTTLVASPATRSGIAVLRSDWVTAAEHLARARTRAGELTSELVLVEYYAAWNAAQRGQPQLAMRHASRCEKLGGQLGDSYWGPMSRVFLGWGRSMLGDPRGVQVIKDAYAHCEAVGLRFHAIVHLMLCAEAHARHGALDQAREFLRDSRAAVVDHEDELLGPRLKSVANDLEAPTV